MSRTLQVIAGVAYRKLSGRSPSNIAMVRMTALCATRRPSRRTLTSNARLRVDRAPAHFVAVQIVARRCGRIEGYRQGTRCGPMHIGP
jgi:hypothetical protein